MTLKEKKEIIEVYLECDFAELVMFCCEKGYIDETKEKNILSNCRNYNDKDDKNYWEYIPDVINNFFDYLGIYEEEFIKLSNGYEKKLQGGNENGKKYINI